MTNLLIAVLCAVPLVTSWLGGFHGEPLKEIIHDSGFAALNLLVLTLAARPAARILGWTFLMRGRRLLGVSCFLYACVHLGAHLYGTGLLPRAMLAEIREHPYIIPGLLAFLLMAPLAATSTDGMIRRLGPRWASLHRLVYPAAGLAAVHFAWMIGEARTNVIFYSMIIGAALLWRFLAARKATVSGNS